MAEIYQLSRWKFFIDTRMGKINGLQTGPEWENYCHITVSAILNWAKANQMESATILLRTGDKPESKYFVGKNIPEKFLPNEIWRIVACIDGDTFKFSSPPSAFQELFGRQRPQLRREK